MEDARPEEFASIFDSLVESFNIDPTLLEHTVSYLQWRRIYRENKIPRNGLLYGLARNRLMKSMLEAYQVEGEFGASLPSVLKFLKPDLFNNLAELNDFFSQHDVGHSGDEQEH